MKFYGYTENPEETPMMLTEVTISAAPKALRQLSEFLAKCANEIECSGGNWEHKHFKSEQSSQSNLPAFVVHNPDTNQ